jgi:hypothetical protein
MDAAAAGWLLRRALMLWLPLRVLMFLGAVGLGLDPRLVSFGNVLVIGVAAALCATDARVMREGIFMANLGTPRWAPAAAGAMVAMALEFAVAGAYVLMQGAGA